MGAGACGEGEASHSISCEVESVEGHVVQQDDGEAREGGGGDGG